VIMSTLPFTVFTPTFNRCELLARTYESLNRQTHREFEWLIVDDGSTDDTSQQVQTWQRCARFPIRYLHQRNGGKHRAHNRAIAHAAGKLFAVLDSDDTLTPQAIERLIFHWYSIPLTDRARFSGVTCLCLDERGELVGRPLPAPVLDCRHYELETVFRVKGEKWGCHRTAVLRQFEFPEIPGENHCPEGLVWNRIAHRYLVRHVNEPLRVYHRDSNGLIANLAQVLSRSPEGARRYYQECLSLDGPLPWKLKCAANYLRYSLHAGVAPGRAVSESAAPVWTMLAAPVALGCYTRDVLGRRCAIAPAVRLSRLAAHHRSAR
jgi:glycosyltransferase involved in cell wall biosynthesis